jgi:sulfite reductase alpha subunit-like flavoprotein
VEVLSNNHSYSDPACPQKLVLRVFHKPTLGFRLPGSVGTPLVLVGPGTGVAPFLGFLEHRECVEKQRQSRAARETSCGIWRGTFEIEESDLPCEATHVARFIEAIAPGPIHLFFGCRGDRDFLFRNRLERFVTDGVLTTLDVAMSRQHEKKEYVTDRLRLRGAEMCDLLLNRGACVYICGDGNNMAKDVFKTWIEILIVHGEMTSSQAEDFIQDLKVRRRYLLDIW